MRGLPSFVAGSALAVIAGPALSAAAPIGFGNSVRLAEADHAANTVVVDVTGDGKPDVVLLPDGAAHVTVHPGNGDGTFGAPFQLATSGEVSMRTIRAARLNSDAAYDLVVDHGNAPGIDVLLSDGAGGFTLSSSTPSLTSYTDGGSEIPAIADWDGDGKPDIVTVNSRTVLRVRINDGAGGFSPPQAVALPGYEFGGATDLVAADLDGDGDVDLAAIAGQIHVAWRQADGSLVEGPHFNAGWSSMDRVEHGLVAADVDGDGLLDLVSQASEYLWDQQKSMPAPTGKATVTVIRHADATTFLLPADYRFERPRTPLSLAVADVNGDGRPDVVTPSALFLNRGDGTFGSPLVLAKTGSGVATGGLDGSGRPFIVVADPADGGSATPVVASSALPSATSFAPSTLYVGADDTFTMTGDGIADGATFDFGDGPQSSASFGTSPHEIYLWPSVTSPKSVQGYVYVTPNAVLGPRTITVVNPDGGSATIGVTIVAGGVATVASVTPARAHVGDLLDVVIEGTDFLPGLFASFGAGAIVDPVVVESPGRVRLTVAVPENAASGPRDLFLQNGSRIVTIVPGAFEVLPRRSLDFVVRHGGLRPSSARARGAFAATGRFVFNSFSPDGKFDPATESAEIRFGDAAKPFVVPIAARVGWKVGRHRATWRSSDGKNGPRFALALDFARHTFEIVVVGAEIATPATADVLVEITLGGETGTSVRPWRRGRDGALRLR